MASRTANFCIGARDLREPDAGWAVLADPEGTSSGS